MATPSENVPKSDTEPIVTAVSNQDLASVDRLLRESPGLAQARTREGVSLLLSAKYQGADEIAKCIAAVREELDIFEAAAMGDVRQVQALMAGDPGMVSRFSPDGFTPLHLAVFFKQIDVARLLLANGADVEAAARNDSVVRPLHSAAATREACVVRVILAAGADPDTKQTGGHTALHSAVLHGNGAMATSLLAAGADPTIGNDQGQSALKLAEGDESIEKLLRTFLEYYSHDAQP